MTAEEVSRNDFLALIISVTKIMTIHNYAHNYHYMKKLNERRTKNPEICIVGVFLKNESPH